MASPHPFSPLPFHSHLPSTYFLVPWMGIMPKSQVTLVPPRGRCQPRKAGGASYLLNRPGKRNLGLLCMCIPIRSAPVVYYQGTTLARSTACWRTACSCLCSARLDYRPPALLSLIGHRRYAFGLCSSRPPPLRPEVSQSSILMGAGGDSAAEPAACWRFLVVCASNDVDDTNGDATRVPCLVWYFRR